MFGDIIDGFGHAVRLTSSVRGPALTSSIGLTIVFAGSAGAVFCVTGPFDMVGLLLFPSGGDFVEGTVMSGTC